MHIEHAGKLRYAGRDPEVETFHRQWDFAYPYGQVWGNEVNLF